MTQLTKTLGNVVMVEYVVLALATLWQWRRHRARGAGWAAASFSLLAVVLVAARIIPTLARVVALDTLLKVLVALLLVFPYCLYRFAASFRKPARGIRLVAGGSTVLIVLATFALEYMPLPGMPKPRHFMAYRIGIGAQWAFLFAFVAARLWRSGAGQPSAVRQRMRLLAAGAVGLNAQVIVGTLGLTSRPTVALANQAVSIVMAGLFAMGLAPPGFLRLQWRRKDGDQFQAALADLVASASSADVASRLLPHVASLLGANAVALVDVNGATFAAYGAVPGEGGNPSALDDGCEPTSVEIRFGRGERIIVWTSPYTPFFGADEMRMLTGIGDLLGLTMERCALAEYERQFIANAAHEFRTPLTVLSGLAATLATKRESLDDMKVAECLDAMQRHGERARVLANNLLDLAQAQRGNLDVQMQPAPISALVASALDAAPPPTASRVTLELDELVVVHTDPMRFEQVLINLLSNAYRYGGRHVTVSATEEDDRVRVVVTDDGDGVPEDFVKHMFEPFARGARADSQGSGLGLAIVRRLVEAIGGEVEYEPARPHGAQFALLLPIARVPDASADAVHEAAADGGRPEVAPRVALLG